MARHTCRCGAPLPENRTEVACQSCGTVYLVTQAGARRLYGRLKPGSWHRVVPNPRGGIETVKGGQGA